MPVRCGQARVKSSATIAGFGGLCLVGEKLAFEAHFARPIDPLRRDADIEDQRLAVGYADLDKFKSYNDKYGFEKGDMVIKELARILIKNVRSVGGSQAFIGHIGGDDFVFIATDEQMDQICKEIIDEFDEKISDFYTKEDFAQGYIVSKDRQGNQQKFGLLSVSIGVVSNKEQKISHVAQIAEIGSELKQFAKLSDKSNFVRDKRGG